VVAARRRGLDRRRPGHAFARRCDLPAVVWDDIVRADEAKPMLLRLARYGMALCDFLWTGTVFRYFGASWQYGSFFFYPLANLIAFALTGALLGRAAAALLGLDDWIYSWDYLHGRRFDVEAKLNQFARSWSTPRVIAPAT